MDLRRRPRRTLQHPMGRPCTPSAMSKHISHIAVNMYMGGCDRPPPLGLNSWYDNLVLWVFEDIVEHVDGLKQIVFMNRAEDWYGTPTVMTGCLLKIRAKRFGPRARAGGGAEGFRC